MTFLWNEYTAADATSGRAHGKWSANRVEIDSRKVQSGDLFVAIKGDQFDGHDFVKDALSRGAVAAVVSRLPEGVPEASVLLVPDTLTALQALGEAARSRCRGKIVGVTGSVGKTSTKEMLKLALGVHGTTYASIGNYNNHIGTPLNLANLPPDTPFAVFEMGMNHAGEIAHLTRMVRPHVAAITTVEAVHLEFFDSVEGIADAKSEIFEGVPTGGAAVLNRDNPHYARMLMQAGKHSVGKTVTFGVHEKSDCRLVDYVATANGSEIKASIYGTHVHYGMKAVGRHWALTSLLVLGVAHALGLDVGKTAQSLSQYGELSGRGSQSELKLAGGSLTLIDDSYNASPAAMLAAFAKTREVATASGKKRRMIAALGNMLELGAEAPSFHAGLATGLQEQHFDKVFTAGELMKHLQDALPAAMRGGHVAQALQLLPLIEKELKAGDVLLVKGSHGSKMYELAGQLAKLSGAEEHKHAV